MPRKDEISPAPGYPHYLDRGLVGAILFLLRANQNYKKVGREVDRDPSVVRSVDDARHLLAKAKMRAWLVRIFGLGVLTGEPDGIEDLQVPPKFPDNL